MEDLSINVCNTPLKVAVRDMGERHLIVESHFQVIKY